MNQWIILLSDFPFKLVTPLSVILMTSALPRTGQPKFLGEFDRFATGVDCVLFIEGFTIRE